MKIDECHATGYNGYCDGYWATPAQAIEELALDPQSKQAEAVTRGMGLARMNMETLKAQYAERLKSFRD